MLAGIASRRLDTRGRVLRSIMPRFPELNRLKLPATFLHFVAGRLHPDGHRYLPLLIFDAGLSTHLGVVDRHHLVAPELEGKRGDLQLVFLLSTLRSQPHGEHRSALIAEPNLGARPSTAPELYGRVIAVPTWETQHGTLHHESLYTELLLDIGYGIVGVRTTMTAPSLTESLGTTRIEPGDWIHVGRSRIDILGFVAYEQQGVG